MSAGVQTGRRLVEHVYDTEQVGTDLGRETQPRVEVLGDTLGDKQLFRVCLVVIA